MRKRAAWRFEGPVFWYLVAPTGGGRQEAPEGGGPSTLTASLRWGRLPGACPLGCRRERHVRWGREDDGHHRAAAECDSRSSRAAACRALGYRPRRLRRSGDGRVARVRKRPRRGAGGAVGPHGMDGPRVRLRRIGGVVASPWPLRATHGRRGTHDLRVEPLLVERARALHHRDRVRPRARGSVPARVPRVPDRSAGVPIRAGARRRGVRDGFRASARRDGGRRIRAGQPARDRLAAQCGVVVGARPACGAGRGFARGDRRTCSTEA